MYADDTLIHCGEKHTNLIENNLNTDILNLTNWLRVNKLIINPQKTEIMLIGTAQNFEGPMILFRFIYSARKSNK